ncbi:hypothetical protein [Streptomyces sp. NPDC048106]|uniref:hypothetical protein n=1 Tax=Streptomyces sp. NPDC048106 TaxID=3155750 RepID=UPI003451CAE3
MKGIQESGDILAGTYRDQELVQRSRCGLKRFADPHRVFAYVRNHVCKVVL